NSPPAGKEGLRMPGHRILTDMGASQALEIASKAARRLAFAVDQADEWELSVRKGNLALSIFLGAFIAYCNFNVRIYETDAGKVEIEIERNSPWWTGVIGVNRVKTRAKEYRDEICDGIEHHGAKVLGTKDY